jgi:hypothetical protein
MLLRKYLTVAPYATSLLLPLILAGSVLSAQPTPRLTTTDIQQAIRLGTDGKPEPYLLHHASANAKTNPVILAAIYTPFLRVAFASRAAHLAGHELNPDNVSAHLIEPIVYVAFRWYCCEPSVAPEPKVLWSPNAFPQRSDRPSWLNGTAPLWIERGIAALDEFGADPPYQDILFVAGFPVSSLRPDHDFVIYRRTDVPGGLPDGTSTSVHYGHVLPAELATWR